MMSESMNTAFPNFTGKNTIFENSRKGKKLVILNSENVPRKVNHTLNEPLYRVYQKW